MRAIQSLFLAFLIFSASGGRAIAATCGDGAVDTPETCDDGNLIDGDGCSSECKTECPPLTGEWTSESPVTTWTLIEGAQGSISGALLSPPDGFPIAGQRVGATVGFALSIDLLSAGVPFITLSGSGDANSCDRITLSGGPITGWSLTKARDTFCGDGETNGNEECDDGNSSSTDTCTSACTVARCGDHSVQAGELCDDGNLLNGDGCSDTCEPNTCGNGIIESGEECDDSNRTNGDGCSQYCQVTACGNGVLELGEECDDGNTLDLDGCSGSCRTECSGLTGTWSIGGYELRLIDHNDGTLNAALVGNHGTPVDDFEGTIDDAVHLGGVLTLKAGTSVLPFRRTGCDTLVLNGGALQADRRRTTLCGDGFIDVDEACDDGNFIASDSCTTACAPPSCGDFIVTGSEECDDGNSTNGDGCDVNCTLSRCGNGITSSTEQCDDGNQADNDPCLTTCRWNICGDGFVNPSVEMCDDGNSVRGDGCEPECRETVCASGTAIVRPKLTISNLNSPIGDEKLSFSGRLVFPPGVPAVLSPRETGMQLLVEDLGDRNFPVWELTHRTSPVPPWTAGACAPQTDRWTFSPYDDKQTYVNRSDSIDPPTCSDASGNGIRRLQVEDHRPQSGQVRVSFSTRDSAILSPTGPLRVTVVLGANSDDGLAGHCGTTGTLSCQRNRAGSRISCR